MPLVAGGAALRNTRFIGADVHRFGFELMNCQVDMGSDLGGRLGGVQEFKSRSKMIERDGQQLLPC